MTDHRAVDRRELREVKPSGRSSIGIWAVVLVGPVTWISHFMVVYLAAEVICTQGRGRAPMIGQAAFRALVLGATGVALVIVAVGAVVAWRGGLATDHGGHMRFAGLLLSIGSIVAILFVGLPIIWLQPC